MKNLSGDDNKNRAWESIKETIEISAKHLSLHKMKQRKARFHEGCLGSQT